MSLSFRYIDKFLVNLSYLNSTLKIASKQNLRSKPNVAKLLDTSHTSKHVKAGTSVAETYAFPSSFTCLQKYYYFGILLLLLHLQ